VRFTLKYSFTDCSPEKNTLVILYVWKPVAPQQCYISQLWIYWYILQCDFKSLSCDFIFHNILQCFFISESHNCNFVSYNYDFL